MGLSPWELSWPLEIGCSPKMNAAGQGCPLRCWRSALLCWVGVWLCAWSQVAWSQAVSLEVRAVWGGGPVRSFAGSIKISDGTLDVVRNLSVQDDAGCTLERVGQNEVRLLPHSPSSFGGVDLQVTGKPDSELQFSFEPNANQPANRSQSNSSKSCWGARRNRSILKVRESPSNAPSATTARSPERWPGDLATR